MSFSSDAAGYDSYRGVSTNPLLEYDANVLLHKLSELVSTINIETNGLATAALQETLIDLAEQIRNLFNATSCDYYAEVVAINTKLESILTHVSAIDGAQGILALLSEIKAAMPDLTEATQLQHTSYFAQFQTSLNELDTILNAIQADVNYALNSLNSNLTNTSVLVEIKPVIESVQTLTASLYNLLSVDFSVTTVGTDINTISTILTSLLDVQRRISSTVTTISEGLALDPNLLIKLDEIKESIDNISISTSPGDGNSTPSTLLETYTYDIKHVLSTDIRSYLSLLASNISVDEGSGFKGGITGGNQVSYPNIVFIDLPLIDTEYSFDIPAATKRYSFRIVSFDNQTLLRYAFKNNIVATGTPVGNEGFYYLDVQSEEQEFSLRLGADLTIFMATNIANTRIAFKYWT
jgi:hypothetical protein